MPWQHWKAVEQARDENELVGALKRLLVVVENYPQLKADQHFLKLQQELVNTENRIQAARRFYNGNVRDYRNKCERFPAIWWRRCLASGRRISSASRRR